MSYTDNVEANFISFTEDLYDKSENKEVFPTAIRLARNLMITATSLIALIVAVVSPLWVGIIAVAVAAWLCHGFWYGYNASAKYVDFLLDEENKNA